MAIQVNNLTGMIAEMKAAGVNVISTNGQIVDFGGGTHTIFVEDPNGMNLELFERTGPPPGRERGEVEFLPAHGARRSITHPPSGWREYCNRSCS